jgi:SNF family Na+-dependent transporter
MASGFAAFITVGYYMVIIGWSVYYFFASWNSLYWAEESPYQNYCKS